MSLQSYQAGWSDGYAEGYGCKLADATKPFNPVSADIPDRIERAADLIQERYQQLFGQDRPGAIGLARSVAKLLTQDPDQ